MSRLVRYWYDGESVSMRLDDHIPCHMSDGGQGIRMEDIHRAIMRGAWSSRALHLNVPQLSILDKFNNVSRVELQ